MSAPSSTSFRSFFDAPTVSSRAAYPSLSNHHQVERPIIRLKTSGPLSTASMNASSSTSSPPVTPSNNIKKRPASLLSSSPVDSKHALPAGGPPKKRLLIKSTKRPQVSNGLLTPPASSSPAPSLSRAASTAMANSQRQRPRQRPRVLSSSPAPRSDVSGLPAHPSSEDAPTSILMAPSSPGFALPSSPIAAKNAAAADLLLGLNPTRARASVDDEAPSADEASHVISVAIPADGTPVVLGRSRSVTDVEPREATIKAHPTRAGHLLAPLPRSAKHVSRAHVVVRAEPLQDAPTVIALKMLVEGQNGCRVRRQGNEGVGKHEMGDRRWERINQGDEILLVAGDHVDLWSCRVQLALRDALPDTSAAAAAHGIDTRDGSFAPSSPLSESSSLAESMDGEVQRDHFELDADKDEDEMPSVEVKREAVAIAAAAPAPPAAAPTVPPPPSDIDLLALVATTVVFSGSSATTQPDLVKGMLESQPSLRARANEHTWSAWIGTALRSHDMFGIIDRKGKDSSGKPLLPLFFYQPAHDPDAERAKELSSVMRPIRSAIQRGGNRAIDWRPVGTRSKRY